MVPLVSKSGAGPERRTTEPIEGARLQGEDPLATRDATQAPRENSTAATTAVAAAGVMLAAAWASIEGEAVMKKIKVETTTTTTTITSPKEKIKEPTTTTPGGEETGKRLDGPRLVPGPEIQEKRPLSGCFS